MKERERINGKIGKNCRFSIARARQQMILETKLTTHNTNNCTLISKHNIIFLVWLFTF